MARVVEPLPLPVSSRSIQVALRFDEVGVEPEAVDDQAVGRPADGAVSSPILERMKSEMRRPPGSWSPQ